MDMGVGSFVFSLGVVSTRSLIPTPGQSRLRKLGKALYKATPLILLGLVRVVMVKGVEYPVSEYVRDCTRYSITGTRYRVWCPLELLLHSGTAARLWDYTLANSPDNPQMERYRRITRSW
jgi:hypothetical protein